VGGARHGSCREDARQPTRPDFKALGAAIDRAERLEGRPVPWTGAHPDLHDP
jgi:hypothetical protein